MPFMAHFGAATTRLARHTVSEAHDSYSMGIKFGSLHAEHCVIEIMSYPCCWQIVQIRLDSCSQPKIQLVKGHGAGCVGYYDADHPYLYLIDGAQVIQIDHCHPCAHK